MATPPLELVEVLKALARKRLELETARCEALDGGDDADDDVAEEEEWTDALTDVIRWIHQRTGINRFDLWEAAHRVGTPFGLDARVRTDGEELRDLTWILPRLWEVDRAGTTGASLPYRVPWHDYPRVRVALGIPNERPAAREPADKPQEPVGTEENRPVRKRDLPPSRMKARAIYDWAMSDIPGAEEMTISQLFEAINMHPSNACEALPPNAETFGRYLWDAGLRRYDPTGKPCRARSIRRAAEL